MDDINHRNNFIEIHEVIRFSLIEYPVRKNIVVRKDLSQLFANCDLRYELLRERTNLSR